MPVGVNFFEINAAAFDESSADDFDMELARATPEGLGLSVSPRTVHKTHAKKHQRALERLQRLHAQGAASSWVMETVVASLGQITDIVQVGVNAAVTCR